MSKNIKALLYNFLGYAPLFIVFYFLADKFTGLTGWWIPVTAAVAATIMAPKFQVIKFQDGERILMKWLFIKGVKEVK